MKEPLYQDSRAHVIVVPYSEFLNQLRQQPDMKKFRAEHPVESAVMVHWPRWIEEGFWRAELRIDHKDFCAVTIIIYPDGHAEVRLSDVKGDVVNRIWLKCPLIDGLRERPDESDEVLGVRAALYGVYASLDVIARHLIEQAGTT